MSCSYFVFENASGVLPESISGFSELENLIVSSQYTFEQLFGMIMRMLSGNRSTIVDSEIVLDDGPGCHTGTVEASDGGITDYKNLSPSDWCAANVIDILNNYPIGISGACCVPTNF